MTKSNIAITPKSNELRTVKIYGGEVEISFNSGKHSYTVYDKKKHINGLVPSVTQILRVLDKPALIGWCAKMGAEFIANKFIPGKVYRFTQSEITALSEEVKNAHRAANKDACDVGTMAHEWIAEFIVARSHRKPTPRFPSDIRAKRCCQAAVKWIKSVNLQPMDVESIVYSRKYGYLGMTDVLGLVKVKGRPTIIDWKSSKGIYAEYHLQLAAYKNAVEEMTGRRGLDRLIIKLGKEDGTFQPFPLPDEDFAADLGAFLGLMPAQSRLRELNVRP